MKNKTDETLLDTSRIKATFDLKKMNRSKNYLMDWLTFINDSSVLYKYVSFNTSYRTVAPQILWVEKDLQKECSTINFTESKKEILFSNPPTRDLPYSPSARTGKCVWSNSGCRRPCRKRWFSFTWISLDYQTGIFSG